MGKQDFTKKMKEIRLSLLKVQISILDVYIKRHHDFK